MTALPITRERVTWTRWDPDTLRTRTSHPMQYVVTEPDGYQRHFDTKGAAEEFATAYAAEAAEEVRSQVLADQRAEFLNDDGLAPWER